MRACGHWVVGRSVPRLQNRRTAGTPATRPNMYRTAPRRSRAGGHSVRRAAPGMRARFEHVRKYRVRRLAVEITIARYIYLILDAESSLSLPFSLPLLFSFFFSSPPLRLPLPPRRSLNGLLFSAAPLHTMSTVAATALANRSLRTIRTVRVPPPLRPPGALLTPRRNSNSSPTRPSSPPQPSHSSSLSSRPRYPR